MTVNIIGKERSCSPSDYRKRMKKLKKKLRRLFHRFWPLHRCADCKRIISDYEWVDNWESCSKCFNKHLDQVRQRIRDQYEPKGDFEC